MTNLLPALLLLLLLLRPRERLEDLEEDLPDPEELREGEEEPLLGMGLFCGTQREATHTETHQKSTRALLYRPHMFCSLTLFAGQVKREAAQPRCHDLLVKGVKQRA